MHNTHFLLRKSPYWVELRSGIYSREEVPFVYTYVWLVWNKKIDFHHLNQSIYRDPLKFLPNKLDLDHL